MSDIDRSRIVFLVADDEEVVRKTVAFIVEGDGYQVLIASDGVEALDISRRYNGHIHLLISDVRMPRLNGVDLANLVVQERPSIKLPLMCGYSDFEIPEGYRFLGKPFTPAGLRQTMVNLLAVHNGLR